MFRAFPKKPYRQRSKTESIFSAVKRKLSSPAPGRSLATHIRQALLPGLAYTLYRLRHRFALRGCQQSPTLMDSPASVANTRLTAKLSPVRCNTYKKTGGKVIRDSPKAAARHRHSAVPAASRRPTRR